MSQRKNQHEGSFLKTAFVFAAGAAAGALAAWMTSEPSETINQAHQQHQRQNQSRHVPNNAPATVRSTSVSEEDDEKKEGVLQCCEICFLPFDEIKADDGQIMATPCGHVFCRTCITESLNIKRECPNCRSPTSLSDLNRLYL